MKSPTTTDPKTTLDRVDIEVQRDNAKHVLNKLTSEYWNQAEHLTLPFSKRSEQMDAIMHQARIAEAMDKLTKAVAAVDAIARAMPRNATEENEQ